MSTAALIILGMFFGAPLGLMALALCRMAAED